MPPAWAVSRAARSCARRAWPGTVRVVFGKALATVALILLAAPVGASADTIWTAAGNGTGCVIASCPTGVPALGGAVEADLHAALEASGIATRHDVVTCAIPDVLAAFASHDLHVSSMGRPAADDPILFQCAAAAGVRAAAPVTSTS